MSDIILLQVNLALYWKYSLSLSLSSNWYRENQQKNTAGMMKRLNLLEGMN